MESASVAEFFEILNQLPFWVKVLPVALIGALFTRVVFNGDAKITNRQRGASYNIVSVMSSMLLGVLAGGYAHDERKVSIWASMMVALVVSVGGTGLLMSVARNPKSTLKMYLKNWLFGKDGPQDDEKDS